MACVIVSVRSQDTSNHYITLSKQDNKLSKQHAIIIVKHQVVMELLQSCTKPSISFLLYKSLIFSST